MAGIYVLELEGCKFYVGKSNDVERRVRAHETGAAYWTRKHRMIRRVQPMTSITGDLNLAEQAETVARMKRHGVDNVRGWRFTRMTLSKEDRALINLLMTEGDDLCRRCGKPGHFIMQCRQETAHSYFIPAAIVAVAVLLYFIF